METWKPGICGICPRNCAVKVQLDSGRLTNVHPDQTTPQGNFCIRGHHSADVVYSSNRIARPLIRNGGKGTKAFREASWEEAISYAAEKIKDCLAKYGPRSLASYQGGSSLEDSLRDFGKKFFHHLGSPNDMSSGSICNISSNVIAPITVMGLTSREIRADIKHSDVIFLWGKNPITDSGQSQYTELIRAKERGAKLVVVDPRENRLTKLADLWLPVRAGTDGALLMALLKIVIENESVDARFVKEYVRGYEELKKKTEAESLDSLSEECGVNVSRIRCAAELFSSTDRVSFLSYTGLEYQPGGVQAVRGLYTLWAIGGKLDVQGGMLLPKSQSLLDEFQFDEENLPVGAKEYPLFSALCGAGQFVEFPKAVLQHEPYPVKALLVLAASPKLSYPNPKLWEKVYASLDCLIVIDRFLTEECMWADVVLPATTYYENESYCRYRDGIRLRRRVIDPVGEAKSDLDILRMLADALGFGAQLPSDYDDMLERAFGNTPDLLRELKENEYGIRMEPEQPLYKKYETGALRADGKKGFPTPSGKFEIKSTLLEKYGYEPLFDYASLPANTEYPFRLTSGARSGFRYNASCVNVETLTKKAGDPMLDLGTEEADHLGVGQGDRVIVESETGSITVPVSIKAMAKKTLHLPSGGGSRFQPAPWDQIYANAIGDLYVRDKISGYVTCKARPVRIRKE